MLLAALDSAWRLLHDKIDVCLWRLPVVTSRALAESISPWNECANALPQPLTNGTL